MSAAPFTGQIGSCTETAFVAWSLQLSPCGILAGLLATAGPGILVGQCGIVTHNAERQVVGPQHSFKGANGSARAAFLRAEAGFPPQRSILQTAGP